MEAFAEDNPIETPEDNNTATKLALDKADETATIEAFAADISDIRAFISTIRLLDSVEIRTDNDVSALDALTTSEDNPVDNATMDAA
jgi:hypothetical protein